MGIIVVLFLSDTISLNIFFFILFLLFFGQTSKMTGLAFGNDFGDENDCGAVGCRLFLNLWCVFLTRWQVLRQQTSKTGYFSLCSDFDHCLDYIIYIQGGFSLSHKRFNCHRFSFWSNKLEEWLVRIKMFYIEKKSINISFPGCNLSLSYGFFCLAFSLGRWVFSLSDLYWRCFCEVYQDHPWLLMEVMKNDERLEIQKFRITTQV